MQTHVEPHPPILRVATEPKKDEILYSYVPYLEAVDRIRKVRGKSLFVVVYQFATLKDKPDEHPIERHPPIYAHVKTTRDNALRFLASAYYTLQKQEKHLIRLGECSNCLFIGE